LIFQPKNLSAGESWVNIREDRAGVTSQQKNKEESEVLLTRDQISRLSVILERKKKRNQRMN